MLNKAREAALEAEGWIRQFTMDEPRLSEAVEMYQLLGFEVHLEPVAPDESSEECAACKSYATAIKRSTPGRPRVQTARTRPLRRFGSNF